jgi:uncharacterized phiE125 gp8 family phage protein
MALVQSTAPTLEPVTRAELKTYLRIDNPDAALSLLQSISPGAHVAAASFGLTGTGVAVTGYKATVVVNSATNGAGGTVTVKIQDSANNSTWADWTPGDGTSGTFTAITTANDNAVYAKEYTGDKAYVRAVATVATATCDFSVDVALQTLATDEDTLLDSLITAARTHAERFCRRSFITTSWTLRLDKFPSGVGAIDMPRPPLITVTTLKYYNGSGVLTTLTENTDYLVDTASEPGRITLPVSKLWPSPQQRANAVEIAFTAGYGASASAVPEEIKIAVKMLAGHWYENRNVMIEGHIVADTPLSVSSLLWMHRVLSAT